MKPKEESRKRGHIKGYVREDLGLVPIEKPHLNRKTRNYYVLWLCKGDRVWEDCDWE